MTVNFIWLLGTSSRNLEIVFLFVSSEPEQ